jgi:hypothetical protein
MIAPEDLAGDRRQPKGSVREIGTLATLDVWRPYNCTHGHDVVILATNSISDHGKYNSQPPNWMAPNRIFLPLE